jgi:hypothetical protein
MCARNHARTPSDTHAEVHWMRSTGEQSTPPTASGGHFRRADSTMVGVGTSTSANLNMQGFGYLDEDEKARYAWPLRFTPAVGTALVAAGLLRQSPSWLAAVSLIALSGALFPRGMVLDVVYSVGVRRLFRAPRLPATPAPRRFSYLISTALLTGSALSFACGLTALGWILGGLVAIGGTILTLSLWCLGSWIFRTGLWGMAAMRSRTARALR